MDKFLKLCETYDPQNADNINAACEAENFLNDLGASFSSNGQEIRLHLDVRDVVLQVTGFEKREEMPEEDEQVNAGYGQVDVIDRVGKIADRYKSKGIIGKSINPTGRKAVNIKKELDGMDKEFVAAGEKAVKRLKKDLQDLKSQSSGGNVRY
jgi:hypothetical protein